MTRFSVFQPETFPHDQKTLDQLTTCAEVGEAPYAVLCADGHLGYSAPIGSAIAYKDYLSPSGVGYDIGCGNKAVRIDIPYVDVGPHLPYLMDQIYERISFGIGVPNDEKVDHPIIDKIKDFPHRQISSMHTKAHKQLGTVGAGNHYVDLFKDEEGWVWIGVHFGSRGFGHTIASGFLAVADGLNFGDKHSEGEMMSPPKLLDLNSPGGENYAEAMKLAGEYAYAGRDVVINKVLEILGNPNVTDEVHNHHNFAWQENHGGEDLWVVRKGSTPLFPDQRGFVGSTMGEDSVIIRGVDTEGANAALYSAPHGAGRAMSRTQAAGKQRKRWTCCNRDCDWFQPPHTHKPEGGICPQCGHNKLQKRLQQISEGEIDWNGTLAQLEKQHIELRGGAADEAPLAYKRLPEVLASHGDALEVEHILTPIGVAMASPDTPDPWKD